MTETRDPRQQITRLLKSIQDGDDRARSDLLPLVAGELRDIARYRLARLRPGETLTPTDLAHEAFLKLIVADAPWESRRHFFGAASRWMHDMLVSEARHRQRLKRGGQWKRIELREDLASEKDVHPPDLLALEEALAKLAERNPTQHEVVMLKYFCGLTTDEVGKCVGLSDRTVRRHWRFARAFLLSELA